MRYSVITNIILKYGVKKSNAYFVGYEWEEYILYQSRMTGLWSLSENNVVLFMDREFNEI